MKKNILIVEDEKKLANTYERFLLNEEYDVSTANEYCEALDKLSRGNFDLIFTDIVLGVKTGIDILTEVKKRRLTCPVVMMTGFPDVESASEAVRKGAYDYLTKPVNKDCLLHITKLALQYKDVVDRKKQCQSNLKAIFKSVKDAIITVDEKLRVIEANETADIMCGIQVQNAKGKFLKSLQNNCGGGCLKIITETLKRKHPLEKYRLECSCKDMRERIVNIYTYPLLDHKNEAYGCVMVAKDETFVADLERNLQERHKFYNIIGKSDKMHIVYSFIESLSDVQTTVLVTGESGTGKELVAEALHYQGGHNNKPLVKVNCAAIPDDLLESELFGHVKGAFTGAIRDRIGRFQKADGGTIFLDEIGDISNRMQLRLLRVVQEMEFECVGDSTPIKVNVRVVSATNQDLRRKVRQGKFREDLYHRLKVVEITVPPLRDRSEDVPLLVEHFINMFNVKLKKNIKGISAEVLKIFMKYPWPGNIRELQHTLEHSFILCRQSTISVNHLPTYFKEDASVIIHSPRVNKHDDCQAIIMVLKKVVWNKTKAAQMLGIDRKTLYNRMEKYGIDKEDVFHK